MEIQPAHLQLHVGMKLSPEQRDERRAQIIRQHLQNVPAPVTVPSQVKNPPFSDPPEHSEL
jgi:hypothetical protein